MYPMNILSTFILGLFLIITCSILITRFEKKMKRFSMLLLAPTLFGGFIVYLIGYWPEPSILPSGTGLLDMLIALLRAAFSTGRMFIVENDFNDVREILKQSQGYLLAFGAVHLSALLLTTVAAITWFGQKLLTRMKLVLLSFRTTYILIGLNHSSLCLAKNLTEQQNKNRNQTKKRVILIEADKEAALLYEAREAGCITLNMNPMELTLSKLRKIIGRFNKSQLYIVAMTQDEVLNLNLALKLMKELKQESYQERLHIFVQTKDFGVDQIFDGENQKNHSNIDVRIFNEADISARQLLMQYPAHHAIELDCSNAAAKEDLVLLLLGFGTTNQQVLLKTLSSSQINGCSTSFIIADHNLSKLTGSFKNRYPELLKNYDIRFVSLDVKEEAFFELLNDNMHSLSYISIALGEDRLNIDTALDIKRSIDRQPSEGRPRPVIALKVRSEAELVRCRNLENSNLCIYGQSHKIFTEDIVINEVLDTMAKAVNAYYSRINPQYGAAWESLDYFTKESNRSAAMHIKTKLHLVGLDMCKADQVKNKAHILKNTEEFRDYLGEKRLTSLAQCEHLRWNAFHFASGWRTWKLEEAGAAEKPKDSSLRRHACLVDWDSLRAVSEAFGKDSSHYQYLDINQVLNIPGIIGEAGYVIVKKEA